MDDVHSKIRRLMARIDAETEAVTRVMRGSAIMASHSRITARAERIARRYQPQLDNLFQRMRNDKIN